MKLFKSFILGLTGLVAFTSCENWLDVNKNPNTPVSTDAQFQQRLPWMQFYMSHIYHIVASNTTFYTGNFYRSNAREGGAAKWDLSASTRAANAQQWFFTQVGVNCEDLYNQAMEVGAYHYAGAAKFFRAYGFMMLADLFGEIPYSDAFGDNPSPTYDNGKEVFLGCIDDIDEAIELFSKTQDVIPGVQTPQLVEGDSWNFGDSNKWLKMCYLLKARWLNHLSKKQAGNYLDGKYDAEEILACLAKGPQSNDDNTVIKHTDTNTPSHDVLGWNEPVDYSAIYSCIGMNSNIYITKTFYDNLTNFAGNGVEDPRADKIIPWSRSVKSANTPAEVKWTEDGMWRRSLGVDLQSSILSESGPYAPSFNTTTESWYCNTSMNARLNDTLYVWTTCGGTGYNGGVDILYRRNSKFDTSALSGVAYARATSPTYMASYAEACFIKAEVLFRQGKKEEAYAAYKNGIQASIEAVDAQNAVWLLENETDIAATCPALTPMKQSDIDNFLANGIGTAADLTMGKIMTQKLLAMPFTNENWNDMRRHDYSKEVFLNWDKSHYYKNTPSLYTYCPEGEAPRRWKQASYELNYNSKNLKEIGAEVPGSEKFGEEWYNHQQICTLPVWWDSTQE